MRLTPGLTIPLAALLAVVLVVSAAIGLQRRFMYPRPPLPASPPQLPAGSERLRLGPKDAVEAWLLRPAAPTQPTAPATAGTPAATPFPLIIYLHGNGELIDHWVAPFAAITTAGFGVLLVEYPGYGRSGGRPSRQSITATVIAAYDLARRHPARIVAYGRSLGGGAACALAVQRPLAALVLESTFTSVADLMPWFLPRAWVLDPFDNLPAVTSGAAPTLVLHGARDRVIPFAHAEKLARAAGTAPVRLPCGHNNCPRPWPAVLTFLRAQGIVR